MKAPKRKSGRELLSLGRECLRAKRELPPADYRQWKRKHPLLRHESRPDQVVRDLDVRLAHLAAMPVLWEFKHRLPDTGIATLRELPKLGEIWLRALFEASLIGPWTTRKQIDVLRALQQRKPVAPRHRSKQNNAEGGAP
jgi:hypothetical protein